MSRHLDVYFFEQCVGTLTQDDHGHLVFQYAADWLNTSAAMALSQSLPLRSEPFASHECRGFFGGILPEESNREQIAQNLGVSRKNDFALLERIGGECAGAVTFVPQGHPLPDTEKANDSPAYRALNDVDLVHILRQLPKRPLMAGEQGVRLSLAGAQDKLAVYIDAHGQLALPLNGTPSTHILKPSIERFPDLIVNEAYCMQLAAAIGLPVAPVRVASVTTETNTALQYLLIERYDRKPLPESSLKRLHQEDFCQALGIVSEMKYQNEGGPSLVDCFHLIRRVSTVPAKDLQVLLQAVLFNWLIGNHDAHGKNFSLLYYQPGIIRLAPLYDLICTAYYPELSDRMAMRMGSEYDPDKVHPRHIERLAEDTGLAKPMVLKQVRKTAEQLLNALDKPTIQPSDALRQFIRTRTERFSSRF